MSRTLKELYELLGGRINTIGIAGYTLCGLKCRTCTRPPRGEGPSPVKIKIQYVLDLRAKLHILGRLLQENLLEAQ